MNITSSKTSCTTKNYNKTKTYQLKMTQHNTTYHNITQNTTKEHIITQHMTE